MNLRLRIHLPLITPTGNGKCGIRVGSQKRSWNNGKAIVLDDSYEHEVWNYTRYSLFLILSYYFINVIRQSFRLYFVPTLFIYSSLFSEPRVVLLFDIWHPDIQQEERKRIIGMFDYAQGQGWIGNKHRE